VQRPLTSVTPDEAFALVARFSEAERRAPGAEGYLAALPRLVCSEDGGGGAEAIGTKRCSLALVCDGELPLTEFGPAKGGPKAACRRCPAEKARTAERDKRSEYVRGYRTTHVPPDQCSQCGGPKTGAHTTWCASCRRAGRTEKQTPR
jgi:hypothetical protein